MKKIQVAAAIIKKDENIFATQRGYGEFKTAGNFREESRALERLLAAL